MSEMKEDLILVDSEHCDIPCAGNKDQVCGAADFVTIVVAGRKNNFVH